MNIGSLYRVNKWHWLLFSSKQLATGTTVVATTEQAVGIVTWYSRNYKENVTYFSPESYIVLLEEDENFKKVLTSDGLIGWTWFIEHNDCFEEVKSE
jgi:hypothetical protein